jgi:hypothetical protein
LLSAAIVLQAGSAVAEPVDLSQPGTLRFMGQFGGSIDAVAAAGAYVYFGEGPVLRILDRSGSGALVPLGQTAPLPGGPIRGVAVAGGRAYVAAGDAGLRVIDVSDPPSPEEIGAVDSPGREVDVSIRGSYAYVAAQDRSIRREGGLRVVDVSNAASPTLVGTLDVGGSAEAVRVVGSYAYVAAAASGLRVVDVSDPHLPVEVSGLSWSAAWSALDLDVVAGRAYLLGARSLRVIDVSDPRSPVEVGSFEGFSSAQQVRVHNGYAFVGDYFQGLRILDVSQGDTPVEVAAEGADGVPALDLTSDRAYVSFRGVGLRVLDVSDPLSPVELGVYAAPDSVNKLYVDGPLAYLTTGSSSRMFIADVSDPGRPFALGSYRVTGPVVRDGRVVEEPETLGVHVRGSHAFLGAYTAGLRVLDVTDPTAPREVGAFERPFDAGPVFVSGSRAYVGDLYFGLWILDVSNPEAPTELGNTLSSADSVLSVHVVGDYAYIASDEEGLVIYDVSNPAQPVKVGHNWLGGVGTVEVFVQSQFAYVGSAGLRVLDISDPTNPAEIGAYPVGARAVQVHGAHAYVAGAQGIVMIDVSNPYAPREISRFDTWGGSSDLVVAGDKVYVADGAGGLVVLCVLGENAADVDGDGVPDSCDRCVDPDRDGVCGALDNCPGIANGPGEKGVEGVGNQLDSDNDGVGDACDNCVSLYNPRLGDAERGMVARRSFQTTTGGQLDDDADGSGNRCDAKHADAGLLVGPNDTRELRASVGLRRELSACGTSGAEPCAQFDHDNRGLLIGSVDVLMHLQLLGTNPAKARCPACPLDCQGPACAP